MRSTLTGAATALLLTAAAACLPAAALAQAPPAAADTVRVSQVFPYLDAYLKLPPAERSLFTVGYYLRQGGAPAKGVTASLLLDGARHPLTVDAYGRILPLPTLAEYRAGTIEFHAQPGPPLGIAPKPLATLKLGTRFEAAELARAIAQADAGMHKAAGMRAVLLPQLSRAVFMDAGSGEAVHADGSVTPLPGGDRPYYEPATMPGVNGVRLARPPSAITLHSADDRRR